MNRVFESRYALYASRVMGQILDFEIPAPFLAPIIRAYSNAMGIAMDDVLEPEGGFKSFGEFFVRRVKPELRPVCSDRGAVVSPCDGLVVGVGGIDRRELSSFSIKGNRYSIDELVGETGAGRRYRDGGYMIIYLHPRDIHRVYVPVDGGLKRVRHIPGTRYPVNDRFGLHDRGIYSSNERVAFEFDLSGERELTLVMVSAFGVGNIDTQYAPPLYGGSDTCSERTFDPPVSVVRGAELGAFRLGSTVVLLWSKEAFILDEGVAECSIEIGRCIGKSISR